MTLRSTISKSTSGSWLISIPKTWCIFSKQLRDGQYVLENLPRSICRQLIVLDSISIWGGVSNETDSAFEYELDSSFSKESVIHMIKKLFNKI